MIRQHFVKWFGVQQFVKSLGGQHLRNSAHLLWAGLWPHAYCLGCLENQGKTPHSVPKLNYTTLVENGPKDFETAFHMQVGSQLSQHDNYSKTFCLPPNTLNWRFVVRRRVTRDAVSAQLSDIH